MSIKNKLNSLYNLQSNPHRIINNVVFNKNSIPGFEIITREDLTSISTVANTAFNRSFVSKNITISYPEENDDILLFYNENQCNVHQLISVVNSSSTSNIKYNIEFSDNINNSRTKLVNSDLNCSTVNTETIFVNTTIPANNFVWLTIGNINGSIQQFHVTLDIEK